MTSVEYERLRATRPELALPSWIDLLPTDKKKAKRYDPNKLVALRTAKILARDVGMMDRVKESAKLSFYQWSMMKRHGKNAF